MWPFDLHIYILRWAIRKFKVKVMHTSTMTISQTVTDRATIIIAPNIMSHVGFRLGYLELTLTYGQSQVNRRHGVSPDILVFLFFYLWKVRIPRVLPVSA